MGSEVNVIETIEFTLTQTPTCICSCDADTRFGHHTYIIQLFCLHRVCDNF
jgi:hypothetical protein